jgi:hypothetical protein
MIHETSEVRELLVKSLKGTTIAVPDLEALVAHWPAKINPHRESLRHEVHERFDRFRTRTLNVARLLMYEDYFHRANASRE